jgi:hypothetical protein
LSVSDEGYFRTKFDIYVYVSVIILTTEILEEYFSNRVTTAIIVIVKTAVPQHPLMSNLN